MRRILASTFVLALFAVALAGPPIDYELICGEGGDLVGVLSLTEGKVHVVLAEGITCEDEAGVFAIGPEDAPAIGVGIDGSAEPPVVTATVAGTPAGEVDLDVVPMTAIDGMLDAQRLRAAALERRAEAQARRETARQGDLDGKGPAGPPDDAPPAEPPADPPEGVPPVEPPMGPPAVVPPGPGSGHGPGGRP